MQEQTLEVNESKEYQMTDDIPKQATCPNCGSTKYFCLRSKNRDYSFVLGISNPEDKNGSIIPYLPVRVLTCGLCNRINLEVETYE